MSNSEMNKPSGKGKKNWTPWEMVKVIFMVLALMFAYGYVANHSRSGWPPLIALFACGWVFQKLGWIDWNMGDKWNNFFR
jgi:hypothetical protein